MKIRLAKKEEFIYHKAEDYMLIMTSGGEGVMMRLHLFHQR